VPLLLPCPRESLEALKKASTLLACLAAAELPADVLVAEHARRQAQHPDPRAPDADVLHPASQQPRGARPIPDGARVLSFASTSVCRLTPPSAHSRVQEMIPILEAATADRLGDDGKVRARPPPRSLKSAMKAAEASAQGGGGAAGDGAVEGEMTTFSTAADANATDSDDDADEDGEALTSGMAFVAMPEGADDNFFGNDDGEGGGGSSFSQWEEEWEETFFDGATSPAGASVSCSNRDSCIASHVHAYRHLRRWQLVVRTDSADTPISLRDPRFAGSFTGGGGDDYSTSRHVSDSVNAMSLLDNPNRFVSYNDEADGTYRMLPLTDIQTIDTDCCMHAADGGSAFAHLPDADAGGMSFGGGGMVGGGMDTSTASLPEPVE
jgi:hypothetical protein